MKKVTVAVENSTWNNIGDAFYQLSLQRIFASVLPDANVVSMDGPVERAFKRSKGRFVSEPFEADFHTQADHYVLSGPILGPNFLRIYAPRIEAYSNQGKTYSLLSVHCNESGTGLQKIRSFLSKFPPRAIYTRDPSSLEKLKGLCPHERSGPCFAFFVNRLAGIPAINIGSSYAAISVYRSKEPNIRLHQDEGLSNASIEWKHLPDPKNWRYGQHLEWHPRLQTKLDLTGYEVVRPVQGHTPFPHKLFGKPNSYISYNPLCYLGVIKSSAVVISDRVHAGVTGLSFGLPVHIRPVDERFDLFTDIPLRSDGPFKLIEKDFLKKAHEEVLDWVGKIDLQPS